MSMDSTVVCFGSSFDPPHFAHAAVVMLAARRFPEAKVWLLPSPERWDKAQHAPFDLRYEWCEEFARDLGNLGVKAVASREEVRLCPEFRGTAHTLAAFRSTHPGIRFVFLCGEDSLRTLPEWKDTQTGTVNGLDILAHHTMLVAPRESVHEEKTELPPWQKHPAVEILPRPDSLRDELAHFGLSRELSTLSSKFIREEISRGENPSFVFEKTRARVTADMRSGRG